MFYFGYFDPLYLIYVAPAILLAAWAQWRVHSAFAAASELVPSSGLSGAQAAAVILRHSGVPGIEIEQADGFLSDHYDPRAKVLRLSPDVYNGRSLAAVGVAAHEAGHALQDGAHYPLMGLRNGLVPLASMGSGLSFTLLMFGFVFHSFGMILAGIIAFSTTVLFQLINLPVEFDASERAKTMLVQLNLITPQERPAVARVLSAAAMTYVAATLMSALQLLYFLSRAGLLGGRRRD